LRFVPEDLLRRLPASAMGLSTIALLSLPDHTEMEHFSALYCPQIISHRVTFLLAPELLSPEKTKRHMRKTAELTVKEQDGLPIGNMLDMRERAAFLASVCLQAGPDNTERMRSLGRSLIEWIVGQFHYGDILKSTPIRDGQYLTAFLPSDAVMGQLSSMTGPLQKIFDACVNSYLRFFNGIDLKKPG
jgi:hypothetical protein